MNKSSKKLKKQYVSHDVKLETLETQEHSFRNTLNKCIAHNPMLWSIDFWGSLLNSNLKFTNNLISNMFDITSNIQGKFTNSIIGNKK
jgi:hypothetical protein